MKLIIVESPTKAKTIAKFLGSKYKVLSSFGHIRDLPQKELGVDVKNGFEPKYIVPAKARATVKQLKEAAKKSGLVILATDQDREGEAIAWHILEILDSGKIKKYQRIVFHEITKKAIEEALEKPRQIDMNLVNAQQARRILDRLVGYKLSPFLWKKVVKGLSAGRVQSVAVRLIVEREQEIKAFKPEEYWSIEALLKKEKTADQFISRLIKKDNKTIAKLAIKNKKEADRILKDLEAATYQITGIQSKEIKKQPDPPFITSTLQQEAARRLGFSAKQTMRLAQELYEGIELGEGGSTGLISYMRTDSFNLSGEAIEQSRDFISQNFGQNYLPAAARIYKTKSKTAQEAHEAIRPTSAIRQPDQIKQYLDPRQYRLYDLIWRRFIACQMSTAIIDSTSVDIAAKKYLFRANGSTIKFDGWLRIYPSKLKENILPPLSQKEILQLVKLQTNQHFTQPPSRYGEASLVKTLEEYGIGRPSTYAPIISTIQERGYVQKNEQKKFIPTEIAFTVIDLLKENFGEIIDIKFTAHMEDDLDRVANGELGWLPMLKNFYQPFETNLNKKYQEVKKKKIEEPTDKKCPDCGQPIVIKLGRFGKFYACSGFPKCKHTEPIINSLGVKCPKCQEGEIIEKRTKKGKIFYSCSRYPKCDFALWDKPIGEKCPKCSALLVARKNKTVCSNKECDYEQKKIKPSV